MFSQTAEYALRAAVVLAEQGRALSAAELARLSEVPPPYLFKVMGQLVRAGVATAQRGKNGGYRLSRLPADITVLEVVNAVDPLPRIRHCPLGKPEHERALCPLHHQLDVTYAQIETTLGSRSLSEMTDIPANRIS
ncbi:Rrf2 family transcriptional regulator [Deinococcus wulumuqiensis]|uniref:Transcriptional regulator n=1 Tax=Deinococcus wulumuqiensis TaxID=980427 RepID=A0AAV4K3A0_9DEIO|nr:RrF2 family transcriptional regulator [Deinococcus wulumuqiensis]QII21975.1 RrF2 family transcriptional regulator [Deinococcus wulumuqiensis R12]GGI80954.1 transcriptional regulator [Deinococcus wulumuqiensis]GGP29156.1 transcriptional regulator [Deinococcus wulumuqiensis]